MTTIFLELQQMLELKMPGMAHYDLWNNQLANLDQENPFATPAVFVEFAPITWTRLMGAKRGACTIRLHLVQETYCSTAKGSFNQTEGLQLLTRAEEFEDLIEDFAGSNFTALVCGNTEVDNDHDMLTDTVSEFTTTVTRCLNKRKTITVTPGLKLDAELKK